MRDAGAKQLITLGLHQTSTPFYLPGEYLYSGFNPQAIGQHLDYMSIHFYPLLQDLERGMVEPQISERRLWLGLICRAAAVAGKPLVLEEFGWKGGRRVPNENVTWSEEHQTMWCEQVVEVSSYVACGWLNWAFCDAADSSADISAASGLWNLSRDLKHWGRRYVELARDFKADPPKPTEPKHTLGLDLFEHLYRHAGRPPIDWLRSLVDTYAATELEVRFERSYLNP